MILRLAQLEGCVSSRKLQNDVLDTSLCGGKGYAVVTYASSLHEARRERRGVF